MTKSQEREIADAEERLERLLAAIKRARGDLQAAHSEIDKTLDKLEGLERRYASKHHRLQLKFSNLKVELQNKLTLIRQDIDSASASQTEIRESIETADADLNRIRQQYTSLNQQYEDDKKTYETEVLKLEGLLADKRSAVPLLDDRLERSQKQLDHVQAKIVEGEEAYTERSAELLKAIHDLEKHVRQLKEQAREYEEGMRYTRDEDAQRKVELDKQESNLKGRERRLLQDTADFEHRKKRYQQLRELQ